MRKFFTLFTAAMLALGAAAPSFAADKPADKPKPTPEEAFKRTDKDGDGKVTESEFIGKQTGEKADARKKQFAAKDANKDGSLTLDEFKAPVKKPKTK
mgnify:CR=1 FL=1